MKRQFRATITKVEKINDAIGIALNPDSQDAPPWSFFEPIEKAREFEVGKIVWVTVTDEQ